MNSRGKLLADPVRRNFYGSTYVTRVEPLPLPLWSANDEFMEPDVLSDEENDSGNEFGDVQNADVDSLDVDAGSDHPVSDNAMSDQESSESEEDSNELFVMGKDKCTRWNLHAPRPNICRMVQNIVTGTRGVRL